MSDRKEGFYIVQISYDAVRTLAYWCGDDKLFFSVGTTDGVEASYFNYVADEPIDIEADIPMTKCGPSWGEDDGNWKERL